MAPHLPARLTLGAAPYDQFAPLRDGRVTIPGVEVDCTTAQVVTEIFRRMISDHEFDVAELGWTYFLRTIDAAHPADSPFVALPVFPNRQFRHSAIYVNTASGIDSPEDLNGHRIGEFALYGHDAGFWPKGILADEHGFRPETCQWVVGGLDWPMDPVDFVPRRHPDGVDITASGSPGADLGAMLEAGEIDALISADVPACVIGSSPRVRRLFPDPRATERDYYARTGIFPMMHTMVIRRELADRHPDLATEVYAALLRAKDTTQETYRRGRVFNNMTTMVPWLSDLLDDNASLLGHDWWPYGIEANRTALETLLRYHAEQGLSKHFALEDVFVPSLLHS